MSNNKTIHILLADDHKISRESLCELLSQYPDIEVVGEASNGLMAIEMARLLHPDVVIMDIAMPVMNGIEATRTIVSELPSVHIIGLSMYAEADGADAMRRAGAFGYLCKTAETSNLVAAIRNSVTLSPALP